MERLTESRLDGSGTLKACKDCDADMDFDCGNCSVWDETVNRLAKLEDMLEKGIGRSSVDSITHPSHYNRGRIEVIDFINDQQLNFNLGNVIKYVCREADKGGTEDLKKAVQYLEFEIERRLRDEEERGKD